MDNNSWKDTSSEINDVTKKIKEKVSDEDIVGDLKDSLNATVESASQLLKNITNTVQSTISDEEIKNETKEVISKINNELKNLVNQVSDKINLSKLEEE